ncbi:MAG: cytochrome b/b6 domain-containing protein [Clostridia bacterium]|nr:cytochrome b/b6 domain-containing protein [Clostridia bacterium]
MTIKTELVQPLFIRVYHWSFAAAIVVLLYTALYTHYPVNILGFVDMGNIKKAKYMASYIALFLLLARLYYGIITRDIGHIIFNRQDLKDLPGFFKFYFFLARREPPHAKYNPGQKLIFTSWIWVFFFSAITGFILYDHQRFEWLIPFFGGLQYLRFLHYLVFLYFLATTILHVYQAGTEDPAKLQAMFTGHMRRKETP